MPYAIVDVQTHLNPENNTVVVTLQLDGIADPYWRELFNRAVAQEQERALSKTAVRFDVVGNEVRVTCRANFQDQAVQGARNFVARANEWQNAGAFKEH
jgi:hypothetical protein